MRKAASTAVVPDPSKAHSAPTPERVRHAGGPPLVESRDEAGHYMSAPRHRWQWSVDKVADKLSLREYDAAVRLRDAYFGSQNTPKGVDWQAAGGGAPGSRMPTTDRKLRAAHEWRAVWDWLGDEPMLRDIVATMILEEAPKGAQLYATDAFGREFGHTRDARRAAGTLVGTLRVTCCLLAVLWRKYDRWQHQNPNSWAPPKLSDYERRLLTDWTAR